MASSTPLLTQLHVRYIAALATHTSSLTYHLTTHLRLNAIYWALTALHLLGAPPETLPRQDVVRYVLECLDEQQGGFGSHPGHDAHILATLSGIQILFMYDELKNLSEERREGIIKFILSLQDQDTGEFAGDSTHLEYDTRFLYCSVQALCLLSSVITPQTSAASHQQQQRITDHDGAFGGSSSDGGKGDLTLHDPLTRLDRQKTIDAVLACRNFDGGFGRIPGSESHASQAFVCMGALRILGGLSQLGKEQRLRHEMWLSDRQLRNGGLNGRPQKLEDVCYSWWVMSALSMLGKLRWINGDKLARFILSAQDPDNGGIADRPDNVADVFHTLFGVAGLSLLGPPHSIGLEPVDPVYCLPASLIDRIPHLKRSYQRLAP